MRRYVENSADSDIESTLFVYLIKKGKTYKSGWIFAYTAQLCYNEAIIGLFVFKGEEA